jgi:hypothetical protein
LPVQGDAKQVAEILVDYIHKGVSSTNGTKPVDGKACLADKFLTKMG